MNERHSPSADHWPSQAAGKVDGTASTEIATCPSGGMQVRVHQQEGSNGNRFAACLSSAPRSAPHRCAADGALLPAFEILNCAPVSFLCAERTEVALTIPFRPQQTARETTQSSRFLPPNPQFTLIREVCLKKRRSGVLSRRPAKESYPARRLENLCGRKCTIERASMEQVQPNRSLRSASPKRGVQA
jgi:hypothetical protein